MKFYPVFIDLKNKKAVVVGGGKVAERKTLSLVRAGASVKVISPELTRSLTTLKNRRMITHIKRNYRKGDLKGAFIVIAGTSSPETNSVIARDAEYLVNVVDAPSGGNFIVPSVTRKGALSIAISTAGTSPAVSKSIRKELEKLYGSEFASYLKFLETIRQEAKEKIRDSGKRQMFLESLASEKTFSELRKKGLKKISRKIHNALSGNKSV